MGGKVVTGCDLEDLKRHLKNISSQQGQPISRSVRNFYMKCLRVGGCIPCFIPKTKLGRNQLVDNIGRFSRGEKGKYRRYKYIPKTVGTFLEEYEKASNLEPSAMVLAPMPQKDLDAIAKIKALTGGCVPVIRGVALEDIPAYLESHPEMLAAAKGAEWMFA